VEKKPKSILSQPQVRWARTTKSGPAFSWESFEKIYLLEMSGKRLLDFFALTYGYWLRLFISDFLLANSSATGMSTWGMPFPHLKIDINNIQLTFCVFAAKSV
jgi:hypothetical protein